MVQSLYLDHSGLWLFLFNAVNHWLPVVPLGRVWFSHWQPATRSQHPEGAWERSGAETAAPWIVWVYGEMATGKQNNLPEEKPPDPPVFGQPRCYLQPCLWSIFLTPLARSHTRCHFRAHTSCHMVTVCLEQVNRLGDYYKGRKIFEHNIGLRLLYF